MILSELYWLKDVGYLMEAKIYFLPLPIKALPPNNLMEWQRWAVALLDGISSIPSASALQCAVCSTATFYSVSVSEPIPVRFGKNP